MMNFTISNVAWLGRSINEEDIYQVALSNDGKYSNVGLKNYFVLYVPKCNNKAVFRDYICLAIDDITTAEDTINDKVKLIHEGCKMIDYFLVKIDDFDKKYNYVEPNYKAYILLDSNTLIAEEFSYGKLVNKRYDNIENDYLENREEYDKFLEKCIVEMQISGEDWYSCEC